jgi:excisionase family DNA binding protein
MSENQWLSPEDVAERLGISRLTVVRWVRSGKLKGQKLGKKTIRVNASDLEAFMRQQQPSLTLVKATAPADESAHTSYQRLDADALSLAQKLQQPGESLSDLISRALLALEAQDAQGPAPMAGDDLSYEQRKPALLARMRAMQAEGLRLQQIADRLNREGEPTLSHKGTWKKGTVYNLLKE